MHSTSFRMSVSIIVILGVFCKAHFKSLRMHDTTENLPLAALLFFFIFLCSYALIAFPVYS